MALTEEQLEGFYAEYPALERYRRAITNERRMKEHTLSAAEEKLLAAAGEMSGTPSDVFGKFSNADMTFPDALDSEGKAHPVSQGTFVLCEESADRVLRQIAYENLYRTYGKFKNTAASLLNAQNKQLKYFAEARKYDSAFEASLDRTNVPTSVYLNLIEAVHQNLDKMHRYVRLRKKMRGVDELHFYDIYTPLLSGADKYTAWEIMEASGIKEGDNLLSLPKARISGRITATLPYIGSVRVEIQLPDVVNIEVTELDVVYAVQDTVDRWWLMTSEGKIVERILGEPAKGIARILGLRLDDPQVSTHAVAADNA